jgi:quercetin dioxygenase-like cupin family protein
LSSHSTSPFQHWGGRTPLSLYPNVSLESVGGENVLFCHVRYEPGATVPPHLHDETEQVMWILEGALEMRVGDERKSLGPGDVVVINRGVEHELESPDGCVFLEALSPVPRDHVADPERDLVLGPDGGSRHVER